MCDSIPSSPFFTFNSTSKTCKTVFLLQFKHTNLFKNGGFQLLKPNFTQNGDNTDRLKSKNSCVKVIPESYEVFDDELGFKEISADKGFEFQTPSQNGEESKNGKKKIQTSEESVSSNYDFLEVKRDLDVEKGRDGSLEDEELVQVEGEKRLEEIDGFGGGKMGTRKGRRQVIRRCNVLAKQVISVHSALSLGFISQLWVDTCSWIVLVVEVRPSMLSGEMERFLLEDVHQVGDFVLVEDESVLENDIKMVGLDTLVGYNVVTPSRRSIGKVRGYTFNINSGAVELLELDSFGISILPSSLVSTYALLVEDVMDVESDTVVVHEAAVSRVQRLTKGFWDSSNIGTWTSNGELEEYPDLERQPIRPNLRRSTRKSKSKMRETEEDWELPMDFL